MRFQYEEVASREYPVGFKSFRTTAVFRRGRGVFPVAYACRTICSSLVKYVQCCLPCVLLKCPEVL